jgi:hypothetical protein
MTIADRGHAYSGNSNRSRTPRVSAQSAPDEDREALPDEPSDSSGEPNDPQLTANEQVAEAGPWFALLRITIEDRMPQGPFGPDNVPTSALEFPVEVAIELRARHSHGGADV